MIQSSISAIEIGLNGNAIERIRYYFWNVCISAKNIIKFDVDAWYVKRLSTKKTVEYFSLQYILKMAVPENAADR